MRPFYISDMNSNNQQIIGGQSNYNNVYILVKKGLDVIMRIYQRQYNIYFLQYFQLSNSNKNLAGNSNYKN